jgi:hypothetical protein
MSGVTSYWQAARTRHGTRALRALMGETLSLSWEESPDAEGAPEVRMEGVGREARRLDQADARETGRWRASLSLDRPPFDMPGLCPGHSSRAGLTPAPRSLPSLERPVAAPRTGVSLYAAAALGRGRVSPPRRIFAPGASGLAPAPDPAGRLWRATRTVAGWPRLALTGRPRLAPAPRWPQPLRGTG